MNFSQGLQCKTLHVCACGPKFADFEKGMVIKMIQVKNLCKTYKIGKEKYEILNNIEFYINTGEFVGIMGPSGSGKTTLLNSIAHFIPYDSGEIVLNDEVLNALNEDEMAVIRNEKLGFVFQDFMLLDGLTVLENVCVPQIICESPVESMEQRALELLKVFDIEHLKEKYPFEISGGQKQRVAVARAMMNHPSLVLADEPTGNLDSHSGQMVIDAFLSAKHSLHATILMVTHDVYAASFCDRVLILKDGRINKNIIKNVKRDKFMDVLFRESKVEEG